MCIHTGSSLFFTLGLDKIEFLQSHENQEIYQKAFDLIEHYFGTEDEDSSIAPQVDLSQQQYIFQQCEAPMEGFQLWSNTLLSCSCVRPGYPVKSSRGAHSPHGANFSNVFHNTVCAHLLALRTCSLTHIWKTSGSLWWNTLLIKRVTRTAHSYGKSLGFGAPRLYKSHGIIHILMWLPFFVGEKEDSSSFPLKWGKTLILKDETKPLSWISHNYLQQGRCLDLLCTLQSTSCEFFHSEPLDYLVAFLAKFALILTETGWFSFLYWRHSSQILKLNHPLPHLQPSVNVLSSCQECWRINTLTLKCDTGLKIPLEQKGEGHILICMAIASLWS